MAAQSTLLSDNDHTTLSVVKSTLSIMADMCSGHGGQLPIGSHEMSDFLSDSRDRLDSVLQSAADSRAHERAIAQSMIASALTLLKEMVSPGSQGDEVVYDAFRSLQGCASDNALLKADLTSTFSNMRTLTAATMMNRQSQPAPASSKAKTRPRQQLTQKRMVAA